MGNGEPGQTFSREDEETLVMFASQAALVIANARQYRDERQARSALETLVETSPVGVVVFDGLTGAPLSFNREASRIVDDLREPTQRPEELLDVMTVRRADGREVSLREWPFAEALSAGETVRAEEIVLSVPDGRSVAVLLNATPIRSPDGGIESFVITLQDMTPLEEPGAAAGRISGHGQPRTAFPAYVHPGARPRPCWTPRRTWPRPSCASSSASSWTSPTT